MRFALVTLLAAGLLAGCGSDGEHSSPSKPEAVIRAWTDSLRAGNVDKAAGYFALPAIVENGTPPIKLEQRGDVRGFNVALPCGAKLIKTATTGRFTTATFKLTGRPGPGGSDCATGAGQIAKTTFVIEQGKIKEWRRVSNQPLRTGPIA
jgi:hypothetical protein